MAKKKQRRRKTGMKLPLAIVMGFAVPVTHLWKTWRATNNLEITGARASEIFTGYNTLTRTFNLGAMGQGTLPIMLGALAHKIVGTGMGVNRMLAAAKIPFIRI